MSKNGDTSFAHIVIEHKGPVTNIVLDRPAQRNAMNVRAQTELIRALDECRGTAKVVVITGNGDAFCAGIDLKERRERGDAALREPILSCFGNTWVAANVAISEHPAVIIAAVNGYALGGGLTLINSCDLAIAADEAELGMPEVTFGAFPAYSGPSTLLRVLPKAAAWLILTGRRIGGSEAARLGLVNTSVPRALLKSEVDALVDGIVKLDGLTLSVCKQALREMPEHAATYREALERGALIGHELRVAHAGRSSQGS